MTASLNPPRLTPFLAQFPKVELHLHLEGSVRPETLRELARCKGRLQAETAAWIADRDREGFRYGNFAEFLNAFKLLSLLLETPADYALATTRLVESLAAENVRYAEITLSAGVILWKKQSVDAVFDAVASAAAEVTQRLGVRVQWIFDAVRQFGADHAREVLHCASKLRGQGVVALGIGGDEVRGPVRLFADVYREARDCGLHVTAHAGESAGAESVRDAVELLGVERIGHGLAAARDPEVMALLRERQVPLEVCLTSNVATGLLARVGDHPLPKFLGAGLAVTLSSDDPAMFNTTVAQELALAADQFHLSNQQIVRLVQNAIGSAFLSQGERAALLAELVAAN